MKFVMKIRRGGRYPNGVMRWRCAPDADTRSRDYKRTYRASKKVMLGAACEICGRSDRLCWNHDHLTNKFRGTLCDNCNSGLGFMKDDPVRLEAAIRHLEQTGR